MFQLRFNQSKCYIKLTLIEQGHVAIETAQLLLVTSRPA